VRKRLLLRAARAQTSFETAFVFTTMLVLALVTLNLSAGIHTRFIANYSAFMAARSFQVYGVGTGADFFEEDGFGDLLGNEKVPPIIRVAEDIFTCSLPWFSPPSQDVINPNDDEGQMFANCHEGNRNYERTNIDRNLGVFRFDRDQRTELEVVGSSFREEERDPLRYGILRLRYKNSLLKNPLRIFDHMATIDGEETLIDENYYARVWHSVYMPLLLNPGLDPGELRESQGRDNNIDEEAEQ